ncbi:hypothetical protein MtrunA17_Chr4g0005321 [Medicago truncatula]|uniref:Transmembrane protein, putative n=1 Tax=Medicago truncatula TaxID=3880 RepID=G7JKN0_MEDTR|nr:transmembrane protein, putative [Medicago truncatula]RHN58715.1 hypothetical protein MtrunA17_Chr4g0005321 [Medicago truncatula]
MANKIVALLLLVCLVGVQSVNFEDCMIYCNRTMLLFPKSFAESMCKLRCETIGWSDGWDSATLMDVEGGSRKNDPLESPTGAPVPRPTIN